MPTLSPYLAVVLWSSAVGGVDVPEVPVIQTLWEARQQEPEKPVITPRVAKGQLFLRVWGLRPDEVVQVVGEGNTSLGDFKGDADRSQAFSSVLRIPALPREKQVLRVKYKRGEQTLSTKAVEFSVDFPPPPRIDTVYEGDIASALEGTADAPQRTVVGNTVNIGVTGVEDKDLVIVYRGGVEVGRQTVDRPERFVFQLTNRLEKGENKVTAVVVRGGDASVASASVTVNFQAAGPKPPELLPLPREIPSPATPVPMPVPPPLPQVAGPPAPLYWRLQDAFPHAPVVQRVPSLREYRDEQKDPVAHALPSVEYLAEQTKQQVWKFQFDEAANIPLPVYGPNGERDCEEGAIIYEGMRLTVAQDGTYEVRFNLSTPAMPTRLRLQLVVVDKVGHPVVLTLPVIPAGLDVDFQTVYWRQNWLVYCAGHSDALAEAFPRLKVEAFPRPICVSRSGTARFGSIPQETNPAGRLPKFGGTPSSPH